MPSAGHPLKQPGVTHSTTIKLLISKSIILYTPLTFVHGCPLVYVGKPATVMVSPTMNVKLFVPILVIVTPFVIDILHPLGVGVGVGSGVGLGVGETMKFWPKMTPLKL